MEHPSSAAARSRSTGSPATTSASSTCRCPRSRPSSARCTLARVPARAASEVRSDGAGRARSGRRRTRARSWSSLRAADVIGEAPDGGGAPGREGGHPPTVIGPGPVPCRPTSRWEGCGRHTRPHHGGTRDRSAPVVQLRHVLGSAARGHDRWQPGPHRGPVPRPRGAGRRPDRPAVDLRRDGRRRGRARPGAARGRGGGRGPGRDLVAELRGVDPAAVRHGQGRCGAGQRQPGLPQPRAGLRRQPVGPAAAGQRRRRTRARTTARWSSRSAASARR